MWLSAIATYKGGLAHYQVVRKENDIFSAYLVRYDGKQAHQPPASLILVRGEKKWEGSLDDHSLLEQIGGVIDRRLKGRLHMDFLPGEKRKGRQH